jgi:hypothetical protein
MAAIGDDDTSGHVGAGLRSQQQERPFQFPQLAKPSLRNPLDQRLTRSLLKESSLSSVSK